MTSGQLRNRLRHWPLDSHSLENKVKNWSWHVDCFTQSLGQKSGPMALEIIPEFAVLGGHHQKLALSRWNTPLEICSIVAHPASCRSTPCGHGSMCVATCTTLQAAWCLCPREWRFPLEKEALCQCSRWAGAAAAGRPCMIITWAYCLQQCQKGHLALSHLCWGLLLSQLFPEAGCIKGAGSTDGSKQWALPSINHQRGKQEVPQGARDLGNISISIWSTISKQAGRALVVPFHLYRLLCHIEALSSYMLLCYLRGGSSRDCCLWSELVW